MEQRFSPIPLPLLFSDHLKTSNITWEVGCGFFVFFFLFLVSYVNKSRGGPNLVPFPCYIAVFLSFGNSQTLGPDKEGICADQGLAFSSPLSKLLRKKKSRGNTNFVKVIPLGLKKKCGVYASINISKRSLSVTTSRSQFPS